MVNRAMRARSIAGLSNRQPLNGWEMPPVPQENGEPSNRPTAFATVMNSEPSRLRLVEGSSRRVLGMEGWTLTGLGFVAGACTTFSLVPQVLKAWRSADREAISKRTYFVASAAYSLWIVHGAMISSMPIIIFNALALLLGLAILVLKLRDPTIPRHG